MKTITKTLLCALLLLTLLLPFASASALTNDECRKIYNDAMGILASGKWTCEEPTYHTHTLYSDNDNSVKWDGKAKNNAYKNFTYTYFLSVSYDGRVFLIRADEPVDPRIYELSFSLDKDNQCILLRGIGQSNGLSDYLFTRAK